MLLSVKKKPKFSKDVKLATFASLLKESDLGCVLLAGALLENTLLHIHEIQSFLDLKGNVLEGFFKQRIFGDFNSKINLGYARNIITCDQYDALHVIRNLRNEAAHCNFDFRLDDTGVIDHLKKLGKFDAKIDENRILEFETWLPEGDRETHKFLFVVRCHVIFTELQTKLMEQCERLAMLRDFKMETFDKETDTSAEKF